MIVWPFIYAREGGLITQGYVPKGSSTSGVTIAAGIDLGQQGLREIAPLSGTLRDRLKPYLGLRGDAARIKLHSHPLCVSEQEAKLIMEPTKRRFLCLVQMHFDRADPPISFDDISDGPATAIMSVTWQYGNPWSDNLCGDFWHIATRCDWPALAAQLRAFPDQRFIDRRRLEAEFLLAHVHEYNGKKLEEKV